MSVFVAVPFRAFADARLRANDLLVLAGLCRFANYGTGVCYPSVARLSEVTHLGRTSVFEAIGRLASYGYIKRTPSRHPTEHVRQAANTYQVIYDLTPEQLTQAMKDFPTVRHADGTVRDTDAPPSATRTETIGTANVSSSPPPKPSHSETEVREGLAGYRDALAVAEGWAGGSLARWAAIRMHGPGGTQERAGVTWGTVAQGLIAAGAKLESGGQMNERLIGRCIGVAASPVSDATGSRHDARGRPNGGRVESRRLSFLDALPPAPEEP